MSFPPTRLLPVLSTVHHSASAYNNTNTAVTAVIKSAFELVPAPAGLTNRTGHHPTLLTYDPAAPAYALAALLGATEHQPGLLAHAAFHYDLVDVARQVGANLFVPLYDDLISAWNASATNASAVRAAAARITALLQDIDNILATDKNFLTSSWISKAKYVSRPMPSFTRH
jgi:alpha-N-acetylglucosaminidase